MGSPINNGSGQAKEVSARLVYYVEKLEESGEKLAKHAHKLRRIRTRTEGRS